MKRAISIFLVMAIFFMMTGTYASQNDIAAFQEGDGYYWQDTEDMILIVYPNQEGEYCASYVLKNDPYMVYEVNTGILAADATASPSSLNAVKAKALEKKNEAKATSTMASEAQASRAGEQLKINAVKQKIADRYGSAYSWNAIYTEAQEYTPYIVTIREDKAHSAEQIGLRTLSRGITIASAAVIIAGWLGIGVPQAITVICEILGVAAGAEAVLDRSITAEAYRGVTMWTRTGTVTPPGGTETPVCTATHSYMRKFVIDYSVSGSSSDDYDYLVDTGYFEQMYAPSASGFNYYYLAEETYETYMG